MDMPDTLGRWVRAMALGAAVLAVTSAQCGGKPKPPPQKTSISGTVYKRSFAGASAAFSQSEGPPRGLILRIANRSDTCAAANDPSDPMDPTILIQMTPDQVGVFPVIEPGASNVPARYATSTLFTFTDPPAGFAQDGGVDAGLRPVVITAVGGEVEVTDLDPTLEDGRLNARIVLTFPNDGGLAGQLGAFPCERVR